MKTWAEWTLGRCNVTGLHFSEGRELEAVVAHLQIHASTLGLGLQGSVELELCMLGQVLPQSEGKRGRPRHA